MIGERLVELSAEPPLSAKVVAGEHGPELIVVSSAATMLEDDRLRISVHLEDGASLVVRSAAAQYAYACDGPGHSELTVELTVGPRSRLVWRPEPLVGCAGCRHRTDATVTLAPGARLLWLDELAIGRSGERTDAVDVTSTLTIERDGVPIVHDAFRTAVPGALGPAGLGSARYLATAIDAGDGALVGFPGAMELSSGDLLVRVLAPDTRRRLADQL